MVMTLKQFQESKREVEDISQWSDEPEHDKGQAGIIYLETHPIAKLKNFLAGVEITYCVELIGKSWMCETAEEAEEILYNFLKNENALWEAEYE